MRNYPIVSLYLSTLWRGRQAHWYSRLQGRRFLMTVSNGWMNFFWPPWNVSWFTGPEERGIEDLAAWRVTFMNAARASSMFYVSGKEEVSYLFIYLKVFILWSSVRFENRGQSAFCVIHLAGLLERGSSLSEVRIIGKWSMTHKSEWVDHAREGDKEMNKVLGRLRRVYRE